MPYNNKIAFIDTDGTGDDYYNQNYINITIDGGIQRLNHVIMGNGEHRFYCGDIATASDGDLVMKMNNTRIDIYKPLYLNDVLFQQGGGGAFSEDVVIADTFQLKTDTISTNGLNDMIFNVESVGEFLRFQISDNTVRVPNTKSLLSQNLFTDIIKPLAISNDISFQGQNTANDNYEEYIKINSTNKSIDFNKEIDASENIIMNLNKRLYLNDTVGSERYIVSTVRTGTPSFNQLDIVNENSSNGRIRLMIDTEENVIIENSQLYSKRVITAVAGVNGNTYNSNGDNTVIFQQNGNTFIALQGSTLNRVQINRFLRVVDGGNSTQAQFTNNSNGNYIEFRLGNHINAYASGTPVNGNTLHLNYYSHGNIMLGTTLDTGEDPIPTISINKFSSDTGKAFEVAGDSQFSGDVVLDADKSVKTNIIDTATDTDLIFKRNGVEYFRLDDLTGTDILNVANDKGVSASYVFGNRFWNRSFSFDTTFFGSNLAGDDRVEYMRWNYADQSLDFNAPIDNTNIAVIGNIVDTTVSDERLKTNVQDVESNYCDCVKNVKIKTFEYKDEKYKNNDKYGFIAQDLLKHLPKEFNNIVKETKPKKR